LLGCRKGRCGVSSFREGEDDGFGSVEDDAHGGAIGGDGAADEQDVLIMKEARHVVEIAEEGDLCA
jgi:hypothetical protein